MHITLRVGTRHFTMDVPRADEYFYREAEKLINKRYQLYADRYQRQENEVYLMMTLLDIAVAHKKLESSADTTPMVSAIESRVADIENALPQEGV